MPSALMSSGQKQQLWDILRQSHEKIVLARIVTTVESCLSDLKSAPSKEQLVELEQLCRGIACHNVLQSGIESRTLEAWDKTYRSSYGNPPTQG
jgi:hypothetical protein